MENKFENNQWYSINGVPCRYDDGIFFWESEDGTKWFSADWVEGKDIKIEKIDVPR